jgi:hypothetical protein
VQVAGQLPEHGGVEQQQRFVLPLPELTHLHTIYYSQIGKYI